MTTATNAEILRQYKIRFSLIVKHILTFTWSTNLVREVKNLSPNFKRIGYTPGSATVSRRETDF